jgi:hypothetical protein
MSNHLPNIQLSESRQMPLQCRIVRRAAAIARFGVRLTMAPSTKLWSTVAAIVALDAVMFGNIASFIRQSGYGGYCGTWAVWIHTKIILLGFISLPLGFYMIRSYWFAREALGPFVRFVVRMPLGCMVALLLTYFVAFRAVSYWIDVHT